MTVMCMNAVRDPDYSGDWVRCGWQGEIADINDPCPRCSRSAVLAPLVRVAPAPPFLKT